MPKKEIKPQISVEGDVNGNIIAGNGNVINVYTVRDTKSPVLHQTPSPPPDFTGRSNEIEELLEKIKTGGVKISGLRGMGGIGKTALGLRLVELLKDQYQDGQFFLNLQGSDEQKPLTPFQAMVHIVQSIEPNEKTPDNNQELLARYRSVLHGKRCILFWDNVYEADQVSPLALQGCLTIITSRYHFALPGIFALDLEILNENDAVELIQKIASRVNSEDAKAIAKLCGYLPLAIRVAASTLSQRVDLTPSFYIEQLKKNQTHLEAVEASLQLSYDLFDDETKQRLQQLSVFPAPFDHKAAESVWNLDKFDADKFIGRFYLHSLIDYDESSFTYHLHDLTRLFLKRLFDGNNTAFIENYVRYYLDTANPYGPKVGYHLLAAHDYCMKGWGKVRLNDEFVTKSLNAFGVKVPYKYYEYEPLANKSLSIFESALDASRRLKDEVSEASHLTYLAVVHLAMNYFDEKNTHAARSYYRQSLEFARRTGLLLNFPDTPRMICTNIESPSLTREGDNLSWKFDHMTVRATSDSIFMLDLRTGSGMSIHTEQIKVESTEVEIQNRWCEAVILNNLMVLDNLFPERGKPPSQTQENIIHYYHQWSGITEKYRLPKIQLPFFKKRILQVYGQEHIIARSPYIDLVEQTVACCSYPSKENIRDLEDILKNKYGGTEYEELVASVRKIVFHGARFAPRLTDLIESKQESDAIREILHRLEQFHKQ